MQRRVVSFARFNRDALARASFLDYRIDDAANGWAEISVDSLLADDIGLETNRRPAFLFHTSYCCSTLLTRALDKPGVVLALREPDIIMGLSNAYRMAASRSAIEETDKLRDVLLALIARPHHGDERVLIKPTNAANNLAPLFARLGISMILLYGDLRGFLASVIKKGDPSKTIIRQIYRVFAMDEAGVSVIPQRDALALTDLQIAALVWRHQIEMFNEMLTAPGADNIRSLDFRRFLENPADTLLAASEHLAFAYNGEQCRAIAGSDLFRRDAKDVSVDYSARQRNDEETALMAQNADALNLIENWAFNLSLWPAKTRRLPRPLLD